jgi:hypothetical protein
MGKGFSTGGGHGELARASLARPDINCGDPASEFSSGQNRCRHVKIDLISVAE